MDTPNYTVLSEVLVWLTGAGGAWVVAQAMSYLAENWQGWHGLPTWLRKLAPIAVAPLISILAKLLLDQTAVVETIAPWFSIVAYSVMAYLGSQVAHAKQLAVDYSSTRRAREAFMRSLDVE